MRKLLIGVLLTLLWTLSTFAQSTTVSGNVTDVLGQPWVGGKVNFQFVPLQGVSLYTWTGGPFDPSQQLSAPVDSSGNYSIPIPSNSAITPLGTSWLLTVTSATTTSITASVQLTVTGTTQTVNFTPAGIKLDAGLNAPAVGYNDTEVQAGAGQFYYNLTDSSFHVCIISSAPSTCVTWAVVGSTGPGTTPRLDQVFNPTVDKSFLLTGLTLAWVGGTIDNSAVATFILPFSNTCTTTLPGQVCYNAVTNNWNFQGVGNYVGAMFPDSTTFTDGDVLGVSHATAHLEIQDLGSVNALNGPTFLNINMTSPLTGDVPCFDAGGPPFWNNCTPGAIDTSISGATSTYTISLADQMTTIDHDTAGSSVVNVTLPTADTLGLNPGLVFIYSNHSANTDVITPTTWTINSSATLSVPQNTFCRIRVDPFSITNWIADCANSRGAVMTVTASAPIVSTGGTNPVISCPTCGTGSGNLSGTLTSGKIPVASGANTLIDGSILDDNSHAARDNNGFDVNSLGAYLYWITNNTGTGTVVNKMVCDDGTGKGIICSHTTSTTNDPLGVAVASNGAAPGTSGSTAVCNIGFCTVVMDNGATANHYAQQSTTVDGDLSDVGTSQPTNGQPYWHIIVGNAGAGTTAIFRNMDGSELNASSGGGGKSTTVQINGTSTKNIANFNATTPAAGANNQNLVFQTSSSGNTSSVSVEVPLATTGQVGLVQLAGGLGGTSASPTLHTNHGLSFTIGVPGGSALTVAATTTDYFADIPFACTINSYALAIDAGTITVKFWKVAGGTAIPTSGNSISTSGVGISSGTRIQSSTVTDFTTTAVAAHDQIAMNVTAVATAAYVNGVLSCQE